MSTCSTYQSYSGGTVIPQGSGRLVAVVRDLVVQKTVEIFYQEDMSGGLGQLTSTYGFTTYVNATTVGSDVHILLSSEIQSSYSSNTFIHAFLLWDYDITSNVLKASYLPTAIFTTGTRLASLMANGKLYVLRDSTMNIYNVATAVWSTASSTYGLYNHLADGSQVYINPPSSPTSDIASLFITGGYARRRHLLQGTISYLAGTIDMVTGTTNLIPLDFSAYTAQSTMEGSAAAWYGALLAGGAYLYNYARSTYELGVFVFDPSTSTLYAESFPSLCGGSSGSFNILASEGDLTFTFLYSAYTSLSYPPCADTIHFYSVSRTFIQIPVGWENTQLVGYYFNVPGNPLTLHLGDGALVAGISSLMPSGAAGVEEVLVSNSTATELLSAPSGKILLLLFICLLQCLLCSAVAATSRYICIGFYIYGQLNLGLVKYHQLRGWTCSGQQ